MKFYAANILLILRHMHAYDIAYRDLKPENLLIDKQGFLKLADFGFARKLNKKKAKSFCGSAEYMPPEMINRCGHSNGVDWWDLGVLLYEMRTMKMPFIGNSRMEIFEEIKTK